MSSFLKIREHLPPIVVGNCTFDLLFQKMKKSSNELVSKVFAANAFADTIGYLNLKQLGVEEIESLLPLVDELIKQRAALCDDPNGTGFDVLGDLTELKSSLQTSIRNLISVDSS